MQVALVQLSATTDAATNRTLVDDVLGTLGPHDGPDLVVLPEATMHDFGDGSLDLGAVAEPLDGPFAELLAAHARRLGAYVVGGGFEARPSSTGGPGLPYNVLLAFAPDGSLVPLAEQDRSRWDTRLIAEGVDVLQTALALQQIGEYQAQAAIAALHCDAAAAEETDWPQILEWYDELLDHTASPVVAMNRAVAVGEVHGPAAGLRALDPVPAEVPRRTAVAAWLHERAGDRTTAARLYAEAAAASTNVPERDHLTRQAARLRHEPPSGS